MIKALIKSGIEFSGIYHPYRRLQKNKALVLMYHGLTSSREVSEWTQVHVDDFERQMKFLTQQYRVVPLARLTEMLASGKLSQHTAVVTFDDGYRSVYELAYPVLKRYEIPATVFIISGFLSQEGDAPRYTWPDLISTLLYSTKTARLDLTHFGLKTYDLSSPARAQRARSDIGTRLKLIPTEQRDKVLDDLRQKFSRYVDHDRFTLYHPMTWDEAGVLASDELISIGGHTRTHPILSRHSELLLKDEILGGKEDLEARLGVAVTEFAYPNGRMIDIGDTAIQLARTGFQCAVTTVEGLNSPGQDPALIKRMGIGSDLSLSGFKALTSGIYSH